MEIVKINKSNFGSDPGGVPGHKLPLRHHNRLVDLDDHPLVVLLQRPHAESRGRVPTIPAADRRRVGDLHHHADVGVPQPEEELLRREPDPQPQPRQQLDPPEAPPPRGSVAAVGAQPDHADLPIPAAAQPLVGFPPPVSSDSSVHGGGDPLHFSILCLFSGGLKLCIF
ncbi:regulator of chromosome condensation family protein [Striga asiatica]|uniref:Regulator of chromosome condensation family protein n=1 Tax=Striga asiatica TaxID=4170 RepID=A0A5A7QCV7_STRAF|nr:regulator of chromosome condensation family protein [Striga asiatica]